MCFIGNNYENPFLYSYHGPANWCFLPVWSQTNSSAVLFVHCVLHWQSNTVEHHWMRNNKDPKMWGAPPRHRSRVPSRQQKASCALVFPPFARTYRHTNLGLSHTPFPRAQHHLAWCTAVLVARRRRLLWVTCQKGQASTFTPSSLLVMTPSKFPYLYCTFVHKRSFVLYLFVA